MVISRIMGGLGNQLFEYAAGRRLALANNDQLKLDVSDYKISPRPYRLDRFSIVEDIALPTEVQRLTGMKDQSSIPARVRRRLMRYLPTRRTAVIGERSTGFHSEVLSATGDAYLDGYWQSELYFKDIEHIIRGEFRLKDPPDAVNQAVGAAISECGSVSLHVRRGDYVSNPLYNQVHGACPLEYYEAAVELIAKEVSNPHFFVFSDDLEWTKRNLILGYPAAYPHNGEENDYEDLRLMSLCKHHIIANSSFSWWGAWLCANPDKIVVAPAKWFNDPRKDSSNIVPSSWWRI